MMSHHFRPFDVAVPEIKRQVARIDRALMPCAEKKVADLVSDRAIIAQEWCTTK
jgi:hypothetical protein